MSTKTDVVIIGGGPAGLAAGIYTSRLGLETILIEKTALGGQVAVSPFIENYPGFTMISGAELSKRFIEHAELMGVEFRVPEEVIKLELSSETKIVKTNKDTYEADAVIIASGASRKKLNVPGEKEFAGKGVSYCAVCDGSFFRGKVVAVVGGGNTAVSEALHLTGLVKKLYVIHRRDDFRAEIALKQRLLDSPNVTQLWNTVVERIEGDTTVRRLVLRDLKNNKQYEIEVDGVFIAIGYTPNSKIAADAGVAVDKEGYIIVDKRQETNIKGVYAAGDVTGGIMQIGVAVGEGIVAAMSAFEHVTGGWYAKKKKLKAVRIDFEKFKEKEEHEKREEEKSLFKFKL